MGAKHEDEFDHYQRVVDEMRKLAIDIDTMQQAVETVRGIEAMEARRAFSLAAARLQEAGYWFGQGLKYANKAGKLA